MNKICKHTKFYQNRPGRLNCTYDRQSLFPILLQTCGRVKMQLPINALEWLYKNKYGMSIPIWLTAVSSLFNRHFIVPSGKGFPFKLIKLFNMLLSLYQGDTADSQSPFVLLQTINKYLGVILRNTMTWEKFPVFWYPLPCPLLI